MEIWTRIDSLFGVETEGGSQAAIRARIAFSFSVLLVLVSWINALILVIAGDGRAGMAELGLVAGFLSLGCAIAGVITRKPTVTMVLVAGVTVGVFAAATAGNQGVFPPATIYLPGIVFGFYNFWGPRCLFWVLPLLGLFIATVLWFAGPPAPVSYPLHASALALAFCSLWLMFLSAVFRSANRESAKVLAQRNAELEHALQAAQAASEARTGFLASMGHELRTPLNGILGMSDILHRDTRLPPDATHKIAMISESGRNLIEVLNEVLDFSKIEADRLDLEQVEFDLPDLVKRSIAPWRVLAREKGYDVKLEMDLPAGSHVIGDPLRVRQILTNLASNAVKFTTSGEVRVEVRQLPAGEAGRAVTVIEVADTGSGVAADKLDSIFDPFVQEEASTARRHGGSGLGLAICKRLAQAMNGEISVSSTPGKGTRFSVALPLPVAGEVAPSADTGDLPHITLVAPASVLIVDDVQTNRLVMEAMLDLVTRGRSLRIALAASGREAVNLAARERFDAAFIDIQMPDLDGLTTMRCMREYTTCRDTAFVAVSAMTSAANERHFLDSGFDAFLPKPLDPRRLRDALSQCLDPMTTLPHANQP
jgi:two-component system, sensor histidine kinase